jgi:hypothetical protein
MDSFRQRFGDLASDLRRLRANRCRPAMAAQSKKRPRKKGTVEHIKVHGAALAGNLENDSPDH